MQILSVQPLNPTMLLSKKCPYRWIHDYAKRKTFHPHLHRLSHTIAKPHPPRRIQLHDVTPRDGLQNEKIALTVSQKHELIRALLRTNADSIEVASFVREDLVPAMGGAVELLDALARDPETASRREGNTTYAALVPNLRGFNNLHEANASSRLISTVVVLTSSTESHSKANVNRSVKDALHATLGIIGAAKALGYHVRAYASLAFACPFEGVVSEDVVVDIVRKYVNAGADTIILADTFGQGHAHQVTSLVDKITPFFPLERIGLHLHDSSNRAHELVKRALDMGIRDFDAAVGGTGGCNFAPGSAGNISTEKLLRTCREMDVTYTVDRNELAKVNKWLSGVLQRDLES